SRRAGAGVEARSETVDHRDRHHGGNPPPFLPAMKTAQVVGPHDPDEAHARTMAEQIGNSLVGVTRADLRLGAGDVDARMVRECPGGSGALPQWGETARVLERIAR